MIKLRLYYKQGCWLCDTAEELINGYRERYGIELTRVDIESDGELYELYRFDIPVIEFPDESTLHSHIKRKDFLRKLDGLAKL